MSNESTKTNQITEGVIWKQLLIFFFPIVVGTLFQQLYNTVDAVIVGRFVQSDHRMFYGTCKRCICNCFPVLWCKG